MISPDNAIIVVCSFLVIFGIVLPILNVKLKEYISYRWLVVVTVLALLIGTVADFDALSEDNRKIIFIGSLVICGGFVLLRTIEKILANGWLKGASIEAKKGDASVILKSDDKE